MSFTKYDFIFFLALLLAIWFAFIGMAWTYYIALFAGYPAGVISLILWRIGRKNDINKERYKSIVVVLAVGLLVSLGILIGLLITN